LKSPQLRLLKVKKEKETNKKKARMSELLFLYSYFNLYRAAFFHFEYAFQILYSPSIHSVILKMSES
jgi:hypothetical protein